MKRTRHTQTGDSSTNVLAITVLVIVVGVLCAVFLYPRLSTAHTLSSTQSLSNIKQIGTAVQIYLIDWDDVYMPVQDQLTFQDCAMPYMRNYDLFTDGGANLIYDPVFNTHLSAVSAVKIATPANTVSLHSPFGKKSAGPIEKYIVGYADSHAKVVTLTDWPTERKSLDWIFPRETEEFFPVK